MSVYDAIKIFNDYIILMDNDYVVEEVKFDHDRKVFQFVMPDGLPTVEVSKKGILDTDWDQQDDSITDDSSFYVFVDVVTVHHIVTFHKRASHEAMRAIKAALHKVKP